MGLLSHSFVSVLAFLGVAPLVSSRALKNSFIPRQASHGFTCEYPAGWENCNSAENRACWVRDPNGKEYNINTNYEEDIPFSGKERVYNLEITQESISPDGVPKPKAQLINGKYPGELIEACWGDNLIINVTNKLKNNGTTIHWHGLRMLGSNEMDGVNGVTQCPVSEDETFQYKFRVTQYGHSWYHSHYSSQYSDGVAAPILLHGPSSDNWDIEWSPIIVADWFHESAFDVFHESFGPRPPPGNSILVNGTGRTMNSDGVVTGDYFRQTFQPGKKHLIRIVNGGTDLHHHFSIDGHEMQVVAADMVPIKPYFTNRLSVAIGQRYSVIVQAKTEEELANSGKKFWIRTEYGTGAVGGGCNFEMAFPKAANLDDQRTGIISYPDARSGDPTSERFPGTDFPCVDEQYEPKYEWTVSEPQNDPAKDTFFAGLEREPSEIRHGFLRWELAEEPLWLNFSDPTILNLDNSTWNPEYVVETYPWDNANQWVYMVINSGVGDISDKIGGAHPIHLHGHDFAVIAQGPGLFDPSQPSYNLANPPRRDVAMLPAGGHLVIAFKPDNPGVWIVHCHIAWHAGSGLALQVVERQDDIVSSIGSLEQNQEGCRAWDRWLDNNGGVWTPEMQEDSGI